MAFRGVRLLAAAIARETCAAAALPLTRAAAPLTAVEVRLRPESNARMEDVETAVLRRALAAARQTLS